MEKHFKNSKCLLNLDLQSEVYFELPSSEVAVNTMPNSLRSCLQLSIDVYVSLVNYSNPTRYS